MTAIIPLGKFERVSVKDAWSTEGGNYTPWMFTARVKALSLSTGTEIGEDDEPLEE